MKPNSANRSSQTMPSADAKALVDWFEKGQRDFPWRRDPSPYRVWIAEIMSQQTVMAALLPYFERFLTRFPEVQALAAAPLDDVLIHWAGLGYYSRARNIHKAAQLLMAGGAPLFPQTYQGWLELPGVGPYTAAAVVSQCFGVAEPVWDGNVLRVSSRYWARRDAHDLKFKNDAVDFLRATLEQSAVQPSLFNQGLMELGALVCTPQNPRCSLCPLAKNCQAHALGITDQLPPPKPRRAVQEFSPKVWVYIRGIGDQSEVWLEPREQQLWFGGLWDFPSELGGKKQPLHPGKHVAPFETSGQQSQCLATVKHQVTHHRFLLQPHVVSVASSQSPLGKGQWFSMSALVQDPPIPLATTAKKVLRLVFRDQACKNFSL